LSDNSSENYILNTEHWCCNGCKNWF
jgi:hypothetical protein